MNEAASSETNTVELFTSYGLPHIITLRVRGSLAIKSGLSYCYIDMQNF